MAKRKISEDQIQIAVVEHLRLRKKPGVKFWHTPNGGWRHPATGARLKRMGATAGVSDLIISHRGKQFYLELKADGRKATPAQEQFFEDMKVAMLEAYGGGWVCNGVDHALQVLFNWGIIR